MSEWRFDIENMPRVVGVKNVEVAYIARDNKPSSSVVKWDGGQWVTASVTDMNLRVCPPETIYAWKIASAPPPVPEKS